MLQRAAVYRSVLQECAALCYSVWTGAEVVARQLWCICFWYGLEIRHDSVTCHTTHSHATSSRRGRQALKRWHVISDTIDYICDIASSFAT